MTAARHRRNRPRPDPVLSGPARSALSWCGFWAALTAALSVLSAWWWLPVGAVVCTALVRVHTAGGRWSARAVARRPGGAA